LRANLVGTFSVIIPAHNEERVIARTLNTLLAGAEAGGVEVIVVCNGCTDRTAAVVRESGYAVRVIETEVASKVHALNLGDAAVSGFPRIYMDADVYLSWESVRALALRLEVGDVLAASPGVRMDFSACSWAVRAFYRVDRALPSAKETIGGSGVYALSEVGRKRFDVFPEVTGDDAFVRRLFKPGERCAVEGSVSTVVPPKHLWGVIQIKTRSHFGNDELRRLYPDRVANAGPGNGAALVKLALRPWWWSRLAVYGVVKIVARFRAKRRMRTRGKSEWERDETSRHRGSPSSKIADRQEPRPPF
jgi:hypothetical protein